MASIANLTVDKGSDFESYFHVKGSNGLAWNLANFIIRGQIRKTYTSLTHYNIDVSIHRPVDGLIRLSIPSSTSSQMRAGRYVYDIEIESNATNKITRVLEGQIEVTPRSTQPINE